MKKIVKALIDEEIKNAAELIFQETGIKTSEAIRLFFYQVAKNQKIPFELNQQSSNIYYLSKLKK